MPPQDSEATEGGLVWPWYPEYKDAPLLDDERRDSALGVDRGE